MEKAHEKMFNSTSFMEMQTETTARYQYKSNRMAKVFKRLTILRAGEDVNKLEFSHTAVWSIKCCKHCVKQFGTF